MESSGAASFSSSGEDAIHASIDIVPVELSHEDLDDFYDIAWSADQIVKGDFKRIALQFPDELLCHSTLVYKRLHQCIGPERELYVMADTSYGSCCVDEVAAQHVEADAIVHYGYACMSRTYRLPVIYVFGRKHIDVDHCVESLVEMRKSLSLTCKHTVLLHEVGYWNNAGNLMDMLACLGRDGVELDYLSITRHVRLPSDHPQNINFHEDSVILYVGAENRGLTHLLMTHSNVPVIAYDPESRIARLESAQTNRLLMRRYATVQKARDADVIGILVGTLGVASYLPLIKHLRGLISRARKKSYTLSVGKLNPTKLANFMEIECFVLVACPENSIIDAKEFMQPIVTPFELELALQPEPQWTGRYVLDFEQILSTAKNTTDEPREPHDANDSDEPEFSLVTGGYRKAKRYDGKNTTESTDENGAVTMRNREGALSRLPDSAALQFFQQRSFRGLEARLAQDGPSILEQGRSGIAKGYSEI
ncbi:diphthamide biosynthesis protein [Fistulina hepatica ATCC 64428]|uniref:2-(3-amino-3-carboxypropyl)histidine synthase subunit 2 n=1 Tax=Fistulina hepatica ATCC 64428 TaxID=1128425 RepID=A0A0D7A0R2_9AGAR|nr:diphthamide biosynthesis protein [Fistulina hepatica ATCC 64428]